MFKSQIKDFYYNVTASRLCTVILENLFYGILIIISFFFAVNHGFLRINDGYLEVAQVFQYYMIDGILPSEEAFSLFDSRFPFFRPIFPFLMAFVSSFLFLFTTIKIDLMTIGIMLGIISGFISIVYFSKILELVLDNKDFTHVLRVMFATTPAFVVYWAKFSSDVFFLAINLMACYYLLSFFYKDEMKLYNFFQFCLWFVISIFIREVGFILIISFIYLLTRNEKKKFKIPLLVSLWILGMIFFFLVFWERHLSQNYFNYFYNYVFPFMSEEPYFHIDKLPQAIVITIEQFFGIRTIIAVFFASLWAFGAVWILMIPNIRDWINSKEKKFNLNIGWNSLMPWSIAYLAVIWVIQTVTIVERYFLPISPVIYLSLIKLRINSSENYEYIHLVIICNILMIVGRLIFVYSFS